jgi:hypothetical protein
MEWVNMLLNNDAAINLALGRNPQFLSVVTWGNVDIVREFLDRGQLIDQ